MTLNHSKSIKTAASCHTKKEMLIRGIYRGPPREFMGPGENEDVGSIYITDMAK